MTSCRQTNKELLRIMMGVAELAIYNEEVRRCLKILHVTVLH